MGQSLCVVGDLIELGNWTQFKAHMTWCDGHVWKYKFVSPKQISFEYKYVVLNNSLPEKWESGANRTMDLNDLDNNKVTVQDTFRL